VQNRANKLLSAFSFRENLSHSTVSILLILFLLAPSKKICQTTENKTKKTDRHLFDLSNYKPESKDKVIFEFLHCGWLNLPKGVNNDWYSRGANIFLYFDYPIKKSNISLAWGAGISWHNISGNMSFSYAIDSLGYVSTVLEPRQLPYRKNIISAKTIEIPIDIRFRTRKARSFKITAGFKFGVTVQNFLKVYDDFGKRKYYDITNYNPLRYGPTFRIGYEQFYICGFYSLSKIFNNGYGTPGITPYTLGFGFTPW
jgi:hypothetical protein